MAPKDISYRIAVLNKRRNGLWPYTKLGLSVLIKQIHGFF